MSTNEIACPFCKCPIPNDGLQDIFIAGYTGSTSSYMRYALGERIENAPQTFGHYIDDCTFRDVGCYGGQAKTPNIDRILFVTALHF